MYTVGVRDLKSRFNEYVRLVKTGEVVVVTDHGQVVAELHPPGASEVEEVSSPGLLALARRGGVSLGSPNDPEGYPRLERVGSPGLAKRLLDEERGDR
jgi:antitoxin (DNA-binding transcriptional repressor) of toxin-antitoxin stability system